MNLETILSYILKQVSLALLSENETKIVLAPSNGSDDDRSVYYENAQIWRTHLRSAEEHETFRKLWDDEDLPIWKVFKKHVDYMVYAHDGPRVNKSLCKENFSYDIVIPDVQQKIDSIKRKSVIWAKSAIRKGHRLNFKYFPSLEVIDEYSRYVRDEYPSIANIRKIGNSVENRSIQMIHISNGNPKNQVMLLVGGQHGREWISIVGPLYIANFILSKFDELPDYMKDKDWYIIPMLNPDGYEHSHTIDRLWRKNRRVNELTKCRGVDTNRNFPKDWRVLGVTEYEPCKEDYAGTDSLSEPESKTLSRVMESMKKLPSAFLDFHAYGQMIDDPWNSMQKETSHRKTLRETAEKMKNVIYARSGLTYKYGSCPELLYAASGSAIDYFHYKGVIYSYAIEGRDSLTGSHGFLLPPEQIEDHGKDMVEAIKVLAKKLTADRDVPIKRDHVAKWF